MGYVMDKHCKFGSRKAIVRHVAGLNGGRPMDYRHDSLVLYLINQLSYTIAV